MSLYEDEELGAPPAAVAGWLVKGCQVDAITHPVEKGRGQDHSRHSSRIPNGSGQTSTCRSSPCSRHRPQDEAEGVGRLKHQWPRSVPIIVLQIL